MGCLESSKKNIKIDNSCAYISPHYAQTYKNLTVRSVIQKTTDIESDYKYLEILGTGSFGEVKKARHILTNELRAIKILYKKEFTKKEREEILIEVQIMAFLDHPNVINIYEFYENKNYLYIVMELCEGGELFDKIKEFKRFPEKEAKKIFKSILEAITYMHSQGITHRDLKPENIFIDSLDWVIKIGDYGASSFFKNGQIFEKRYGTPYYIAPEVLNHSYNEKCDLWSLGVILYVLLSGKPPFYGRNENEIFEKILIGEYKDDIKEFEDITDDAKDLMKNLLNLDFKKRFSAKQSLQHKFFEELNQIQADKNELEKKTLENFRKLVSSSKLNQCILFFLTKEFITNIEKSDAIRIFKKWDNQNNGKLCKYDFENAFFNENILIPQSEIDFIFKTLSINRYIPYTFFLAAFFIDNNKFINKRKINSCFKFIDSDNKGKISKMNIKDIFLKNFIKDEEFNKIFDDDFPNSEGVITYDEFEKFVLLNLN